MRIWFATGGWSGSAATPIIAGCARRAPVPVSAAPAPSFRPSPEGRTFAAMTATRTTEETWAKRVDAWRASGETADVFAHGKGYEGSTLRWWSSRLGRAEQPRFLRLLPKA